MIGAGVHKERIRRSEKNKCCHHHTHMKIAFKLSTARTSNLLDTFHWLYSLKVTIHRPKRLLSVLFSFPSTTNVQFNTLSPKKLSCQNMFSKKLSCSRNGTQASTTHHRAQRDAKRSGTQTRVGRESRVSFLKNFKTWKIYLINRKGASRRWWCPLWPFWRLSCWSSFSLELVRRDNPPTQNHTTIAINIPLLWLIFYFYCRYFCFSSFCQIEILLGAIRD